MDTVFSTSGFVSKTCMHCDARSMVAAASTEAMNVGTQLMISAGHTEQKPLYCKLAKLIIVIHVPANERTFSAL